MDLLRTASTADVPNIVRQLQGYQRWANPRLKALVQSAADASREKLHASLALLPFDSSQLPFLERRLLDATPAEAAMIATVWKEQGCIPIERLREQQKLGRSDRAALSRP